MSFNIDFKGEKHTGTEFKCITVKIKASNGATFLCCLLHFEDILFPSLLLLVYCLITGTGKTHVNTHTRIKWSWSRLIRDDYGKAP